MDDYEPVSYPGYAASIHSQLSQHSRRSRHSQHESSSRPHSRAPSQSGRSHRSSSRQSPSARSVRSLGQESNMSERLNPAEIKRILDKLKSELDTARMKNKDQARERSEEMARLRRWFEEEKAAAVEGLEHEMMRAQERAVREAEKGAQVVLKAREEEIRLLKDRLKEVERNDREESSGTGEVTLRLQKEIKSLRSNHREIEDKYMRLKDTEDALRMELKQLKGDQATIMTRQQPSRAASVASFSLARVDPMVLRSLETLRVDLNRRVVDLKGLDNAEESISSMKMEEVLRTLHELKAMVEQMEGFGVKPATSPDSVNNRITELEGETKALRVEKEELKRQTVASGDSEEKVKKLKRRNAELIAFARRMEEKMKNLQSTKAPGTNAADIEELRREYEERRAEDIAEHAKLLLDREKELETIRRLMNRSKPASEKNSVERQALEEMLKTAQRERIVLEKQITWYKDVQKVDLSAKERVQSLTKQLREAEKVRDHLQKELSEIRIKARKLAHWENTAQTREKENSRLKEQLNVEREKSVNFGEEVQRLAQKNTELVVENSDLQTRVLRLDELNEESNSLRQRLEWVESSLEGSQSQTDTLQEQLAQMEQLMRRLQQAAEKRGDLEREHSDLQALLRVKEREASALIDDKDQAKKRELNESIENLKAKLREIEKRTALQALKHEEVMLELESVRKKQKYEELSAQVFSSGPSVGIMNGYMEDMPSNRPSGSSAGFSDGFFYGELLDGRSGMVPSTFVEQIDTLQSGNDFNFGSLLARTEDGAMSNSSNRGSTEAEDVPPPRQLTLERQLAQSVLISWRPPEGLVQGQEISAYHIYVEGQFRASVRATEKTRALVDGVDASKIQRVSVRAVVGRGQSRDAECTLLVGKAASAAPSRLKASQITSSTAKLSWLPGNSNYHHAVLVNEREVRLCPPAQCKILLTGLQPDSLQRVCVRGIRNPISNPVKGITIERPTPGASREDDGPLTVTVDFRTLPGGVPEPPSQVQVEAGPQDGHLLITWQPPALTVQGTSCGVTVRGYVIQVNGAKVLDVSSAASDHTLLELSLLRTVPLPPPSSHPLDVHSLPEASAALEGADPNNPGIRPPSALNLTVHSVAGLPHNPVLSEPSRPPVPLTAQLLAQVAGTAAEAAALLGPSVAARLRMVEVEPSSNSELSDIQEEEERDLRRSPNGHHDREVGKSPTEDRLPLKMISVPEIHITKHSSLTDEDDLGPPPDEISPDLSPEEMTPYAYDRRSARHVSRSREMGGTRGVSRRPHSEENILGEIGSGRRGTREGKVRAWRGEHVSRASQGGAGTHYGRKHHNHRAHSDSPRSLRDSRGKHGRVQREDVLDTTDLIDYEEEGTVDSLTDELEWGSGPPDLAGPDLGLRGPGRERVRVFVALFDYDPSTMSPNPDAVQEELPFREGQLIKIYGELDEDGFYYGECNGNRGLVPYNMVSEVHMEEGASDSGLPVTDTAGPAPPAPGRRERNPQTRHRSSHAREGNMDGGGPGGTPPLLPPASPRASHSQRAHPPHPSQGHHRPPPMTNQAPAMRQPTNQQPVVPPPPPTSPMRRMVALYDYDPQSLSPNVDVDAELPFRAGDHIFVMGDMDEDGFFIGELNGRRGLVPSNFLQEVPPDTSQEDPSLVPLPNENHVRGTYGVRTNSITPASQSQPYYQGQGQYPPQGYYQGQAPPPSHSNNHQAPPPPQQYGANSLQQPQYTQHQGPPQQHPNQYPPPSQQQQQQRYHPQQPTYPQQQQYPTHAPPQAQQPPAQYSQYPQQQPQQQPPQPTGPPHPVQQQQLAGQSQPLLVRDNRTRSTQPRPVQVEQLPPQNNVQQVHQPAPALAVQERQNSATTPTVNRTESIGSVGDQSGPGSRRSSTQPAVVVQSNPGPSPIGRTRQTSVSVPQNHSQEREVTPPPPLDPDEMPIVLDLAPPKDQKKKKTSTSRKKEADAQAVGGSSGPSSNASGDGPGERKKSVFQNIFKKK